MPLLWENESFLTCGEIIKTHGYQGKVKISFSEAFDISYHTGDWILIEFNKKPVPFLIQDITPSQDEIFIIKLTNINSDEEARELLNRKVLIQKSKAVIIDEEARLADELPGFILYDQNKAFVGSITEVQEHEHQFLLAVNTLEKKEILIPLHADLIIGIDEKDKTISMNLPEGLVE